MSFRHAMARGFTLIEMAIVLVVVGLILSGGILAVGPILDNTKTSETQSRLDTIEKALLLYTIQNGCLPCPADGTVTTSLGVAAPTGCGACTVAAANGVVPWTTLGLSQNDATDGWSNRISYRVSATLAASTTAMVRNGTTYPAGTLRVEDADPNTTAGANSLLSSAAAYVLISHGKDGYGARTTSGTAFAAAPVGNTVQIDNATKACDSPNPCHQGDRIDLQGDNSIFDDIVRWRTAPLIIQQCGDNACGNPA